MTSGQQHQPHGFAAIEAVLIANGWVSQAQIDRVRPLASDPSRLLRTLVEQNIIQPENVVAVEGILHQQGQLPNFTILRKLGAGGMGTVFLATHLASGQQCALKVISMRLADDREFLNRFHRETNALVGLRHPNLANVIESGTQGTTHYLAMEHVSGPNLASLLKEFRALPEHYVLTLVKQLAECLAYVYGSAGLVHRDIKPENVLIQRSATGPELFPLDDQAKLIDFGLVKAANDDEHLTQTGMTIGTPLYMSPEQVRGDKLDCRSDIYGLGATIYHLLTGAPPFRGSSPGAIMSAHLTDPVPDPGDSVPSLCAATRRMAMTAMIKDADRRYLTWEAFIKACDEAIEELREKSGSSIRLLRKPLVIAKKSRGRPGTDRIEGQTTDARIGLPVIESPPPPPPPPSLATSDRIQRKHAERRQGQVDSQRFTKPGALPQPSGAATGALIKVQTDKLLRQRQEAAAAPVITPTMVPSDERSAVYSEDAGASPGTGIIPWLILGSAVLIAGAIVAYHLTSR